MVKQFVKVPVKQIIKANLIARMDLVFGFKLAKFIKFD